MERTYSSFIDGAQTQIASTEALVKSVFGASNIDTGLLPPAVRWVSSDGLGVLFERPPSRQLLRFNGKLYEVSTPWLVYYMSLFSTGKLRMMYLFARTAPLMSLDDELYQAPLPNLWGDGRVCIHSDRSYSTLSAAIKGHLAEFWGSEFNFELELDLSIMLALGLPEETQRSGGHAQRELIDFLESKTPEEMVGLSYAPARYRTVKDFLTSKYTTNTKNQTCEIYWRTMFTKVEATNA